MKGARARAPTDLPQISYQVPHLRKVYCWRIGGVFMVGCHGSKHGRKSAVVLYGGRWSCMDHCSSQARGTRSALETRRLEDIAAYVKGRPHRSDGEHRIFP
jgi:hypothetical protein